MIEYVIKLKRKVLPVWRDRWVWTMAWRDARHNRTRLFLLVASLITGIAAVVSIGSLNYSLQETLDQNAKELLGADLVVNSSRKLPAEVTRRIDSLKLKTAADADLASMVMFMNTHQSRLVKLTAIKGDFPFYGQLETKPADGYQRMKEGRLALLDESLAVQYEISSEDSLKIGNKMFKVAGVVTKIPGGGELSATLAPSVYISMRELDSTGLVQFGSRVNYRTYVKTADTQETDKLVSVLKPIARKLRISYETVERRKEGLGRSFGSVYQFFQLLAFVALLLGCIGVASAVHIYAREKREEVAVLRCVGSTGWQAFNIYFIQVFLLGLLGSVLGAGLGAAIQRLIPIVFGSFIPVDLPFSISWAAVAEGLILGAIVSVLFSVLPLASVRFVPPLTVLRAETGAPKRRSRLKTLAWVLIVIFPVLAASWQAQSWMKGVFFSTGIAVALGLLALVAWLLLKAVRKFFPSGAGFVFRHSLASLYRPNNQTQVLMVTIGLGGFIVATLNITQASLLGQVEFRGTTNQSNTILFDIQPAQKDGVLKLMSDYQLPAKQTVPIITCRVKEVKGRTTEVLLADTANRIPEWALTREYRVTYRDSLHTSEELTKGKLQHFDKGSKDSVWVTISEGMHESLRVDIGDSILFDIQGIPLMTRVSGLRKIDWPKDPPNFLFVFPTGVLENAPQVWVATTRMDDETTSTRFQQDLVMGYPNVSLIDLRLILSTVEKLFAKVSLVIRFLALFSIVTGLIVLAGAVANSKFLRIKENVLLRTLGARTSQLFGMTLIEYAYLGLFSAATGILLSLGAGWVLCRFFFEVPFVAAWLELGVVGLVVTGLTIFIGWFNSREVISSPPLQVLRKES